MSIYTDILKAAFFSGSALVLSAPASAQTGKSVNVESKSFSQLSDSCLHEIEKFQIMIVPTLNFYSCISSHAMEDNSRDAVPEGNFNSWINFEDFVNFKNEKISRNFTVANVEIAEDGSISNCYIILSSGSQILDNLYCSKISERGKFKPALDKSGVPIKSSMRMVTPWRADQVEMAPIPRGNSGYWVAKSDYSQQFSKLKIEETLEYNLFVGADGYVKKCDLTKSTNNFNLSQFTCEIIKKRARFIPASDKMGSSINGIFKYSVKLAL